MKGSGLEAQRELLQKLCGLWVKYLLQGPDLESLTHSKFIVSELDWNFTTALNPISPALRLSCAKANRI